MVFVEFLKKCGCPPTDENEALSGNLADFWFDASSETARAYYRLRISRADALSGSVAMLKVTVYRPARAFDSTVIRNLTFLDFTLGSIASTCGAHTEMMLITAGVNALKLIEGAEAPRCLLKAVTREEVAQPPDFAWFTFYVSKDGSVVRTGSQQDVGQSLGLSSNERLSSNELGWEAPPGSALAKVSAESFIEFLKKCGYRPSKEHGLWGTMADFWFDASSEATHAYYRLRVSSVYMYSWSVMLLLISVYWPRGEFDPAVMRNVRFLDGFLRSIAVTCGAKKLTKKWC